MTARELLQEARRFLNSGWVDKKLNDRIDAFLAQPEQEPVAWMALCDGVAIQTAIHPDRSAWEHYGWTIAPLYAAQPEPKSIRFCKCDEQATQQELDTLKCSACGGRLL